MKIQIRASIARKWCILNNMEGLGNLVMEPSCDVKEKGTRINKNANEASCLCDNEKINVNSKEGSYLEEDCKKLEQDEIEKSVNFDINLTMNTRIGGRWGRFCN